jgi:hypothetical protein
MDWESGNSLELIEVFVSIQVKPGVESVLEKGSHGGGVIRFEAVIQALISTL